MSQDFDPYYTWLGIPKSEQPPDHYRLLGVSRLEANQDVISNAADRQMAFIKNFQSGQHSAASQKVLNAIAAAKTCLLDPAKKATYDQALRAKLRTLPGKQPIAPTSPPSAKGDPHVPRRAEPLPVAQPLPQAAPQPQIVIAPTPLPISAGRPSVRIKTTAPAGPGADSSGGAVPPWKNPVILASGGGGVAGLLLLVILISLLGGGFKSDGDSGSVVVATSDTSNSVLAPPPTPPGTLAPPESPQADPTPPQPIPQPVAPAPAILPEDNSLPPIPGQPNALRFAGDGFVFVMNAEELTNLGREYTVELWFRYSQESLNGKVLENWGDQTMGGWALRFYSTSSSDPNQLNLGVVFSGTQGVGALDHGWHHVAVCCSRAVISCFVDGDFKTSRSFSASSPSKNLIYVGGSAPDSAGKGLHGDVRAFRISSTKRYTGSFSPPPTFDRQPDTVVLLDFTRGGGLILPDLSGQGHHGAIVGGKWISVNSSPLGSGATPSLPSSSSPSASTVVSPGPVTPPSTPPATPSSASPSATISIALPPATGKSEALLRGQVGRSKISVDGATLSPPSGVRQAEVRAQVSANFKTDGNTAEKFAAAQQILKEATNPALDPDTRYIYFEKAFDAALGAGAIPLALTALDSRDSIYQPANFWGDRIDLLKRGVEFRDRYSPDAQDKVSSMATRLLADAHRSGYHKEAVELAGVALAMNSKPNDPVFTEPLLWAKRQAEEAVTQAQAAADIIPVLARSPADRQANEIMGKYQCFYRDNWSRGNHYLAYASDPNLAAIGRLEQVESPSPQQLMELGNLYVNWAGGAKGWDQVIAYDRALTKFRAAVGNLAGSERTNVEQTIAVVQDRLNQIRRALLKS